MAMADDPPVEEPPIVFEQTMLDRGLCLTDSLAADAKKLEAAIMQQSVSRVVEICKYMDPMAFRGQKNVTVRAPLAQIIIQASIWGDIFCVVRTEDAPMLLFRAIMQFAYDDGSALRLGDLMRLGPYDERPEYGTPLEFVRAELHRSSSTPSPLMRTRQALHKSQGMLQEMISELERATTRQRVYQTTLASVVASVLSDTDLQDLAREIGVMCAGYLLFP